MKKQLLALGLISSKLVFAATMTCNSWQFKPASCDTGVIGGIVSLLSEQSGGKLCYGTSNYFETASPSGSTIINVVNGCRGTFSVVQPAAPVAPYWLPQDASGWSIIPTSFGITLYADSVSGLDSNPGIDPLHPVKTLTKAMSLLNARPQGTSAHLLLKRGSVFPESVSILRYGISAALPVVIDGWNYGLAAAPRPQVLQIQTWTGSYIALLGIGFKGTGVTEAIELRGPATDVLVEDCVVDGYWQNITADGITNLVLRRSQSVNAWDANFSKNDESKPQGMYLSNSNNAILEDNVFDHNAYHNDDLSDATEHGHDLYISNGAGILSHGIILRNNLISNGLQSVKGPASGAISGNLFYSDGTSGYMGSQGGSFTGNVEMNSSGKTVKTYHLSNPTATSVESGGFGIDGNMSLGSGKNALVTLSGNLVLNITGNAFGVADAQSNFVLSGNTVVNADSFFGFWATPLKGVVSNNLFQGSAKCKTIDNTNGNASTIAFSSNTYYCQSGQAYPSLFQLGYGNHQNWAQYLALSRETGAQWAQVQFVNPSWNLDFPSFLAQLKAQQKGSWKPLIQSAVAQALSAYKVKQ